MKRQKRNPMDKAYQRGFLAGLEGRSKTLCPKAEGAEHQEWMNGWRAGREDMWSGYHGASAVHKVNRVVYHQIHDG